jgi:hypothetical protein
MTGKIFCCDRRIYALSRTNVSPIFELEQREQDRQNEWELKRLLERRW